MSAAGSRMGAEIDSDLPSAWGRVLEASVPAAAAHGAQPAGRTRVNEPLLAAGSAGASRRCWAGAALRHWRPPPYDTAGPGIDTLRLQRPGTARCPASPRSRHNVSHRHSLTHGWEPGSAPSLSRLVGPACAGYVFPCHGRIRRGGVEIDSTLAPPGEPAWHLRVGLVTLPRSRPRVELPPSSRGPTTRAGPGSSGDSSTRSCTVQPGRSGPPSAGTGPFIVFPCHERIRRGGVEIDSTLAPPGEPAFTFE